jgi:hypothetical protein
MVVVIPLNFLRNPSSDTISEEYPPIQNLSFRFLRDQGTTQGGRQPVKAGCEP